MGEFDIAVKCQTRATSLLTDRKEMDDSHCVLNIYEQRQSLQEKIRDDPKGAFAQYNSIVILFLTRNYETVCGMTKGLNLRGYRGEYFSFYADLLGYYIAARRIGQVDLEPRTSALPRPVAQCAGSAPSHRETTSGAITGTEAPRGRKPKPQDDRGPMLPRTRSVSQKVDQTHLARTSLPLG